MPPDMVYGSSPHIAIDLTNDDYPSYGKRKRHCEPDMSHSPLKSATSGSISKAKRAAPGGASSSKNGTGTEQDQYAEYESPSKKAKRSKAPKEEKRARRFRPQAPQSFSDTYLRATTQRFYVLERRREGTDECPEEVIELTGSTGNIYKVRIGLVPSCNCPAAAKGNQCKHTVFVLSKVLHARPDLVYQLALLSSELREIFASAPPIDAPSEGDSSSDKRKPIDGDCPICFSELEPDKVSEIVWCRAACGQNMHQECFETWARTKSGKVTCPMCRSEWEGDENMVNRVEKSRGTMSEGYVNVASQLGISTVRDTSTYSEWFGRRRRGGGRGRGGRNRYRGYGGYMDTVDWEEEVMGGYYD